MTAQRQATDPGCIDQTAATGFALRSVVAGALVLTGPTAAWVLCISWRVESASDAQHVMWFVTTAGLCLVAGAVMPFRPWVLGLLSVGAVVATLVTLFQWWSSVDSTGMFGVGLIMATPPVIIAAPLLLLIGGAVRDLAERDGHRLAGT